jgi:hypothetical protein
MANKSQKICIVGSGLSAYGALIASMVRDFEITIIDIGENIPEHIATQVSQMDKQKPSLVHLGIINIASQEGIQTLTKRDLPKKTLFGSKYFYHEETLDDSHKLPFSEAMGGYSVAWGAAVLPPNKDDLLEAPFAYEDLARSIQILAPHLNIPFYEDGLTQEFPNFMERDQNSSGLKLSKSQTVLLERLLKLQVTDGKSKCLIGQARILTRSEGENRCRYCGMCSHGCVFNSIFSSKNEIQKLVEENRISYLGNRRVLSVEEVEGQVRIHAINLRSGEDEIFDFDTVFVAAGAVNSTKIAMKSLDLKELAVRFLKTGGFVRPYFSLNKLGLDWPNQNTQANIFMEIRDPSVSNYWIHSQISTANEIVILGLGFMKRGFMQKFIAPLRDFFLQRLVVVMTNMHSNDGPHYEISAVAVGNSQNFLGSLEIPKPYLRAERRVERLIKKKLLRSGLLSIPFARKGVSNGPGYHVGGSLAMKGASPLATDELGRLQGHQNVFFVDTSVLPMIPGTTIGLFAMANAHRIASKVLGTIHLE